jgi:hypothetical protein
MSYTVKSDTLSTIQKTLHDSFLACTKQCEGLPKALQRIRRDQLPTAALDASRIRSELEKNLRPIYELMATAMFRVGHLLFPELKAINLYFWPGYHSLISHDRINYVHSGEACGFGVSDQYLTRDTDPITYLSCCNAQWHKALFQPVKLRRRSQPLPPPSLHEWLVNQRPKISSDPNDIVHALIISTQAVAETTRFPEYKALHLASDSASASSEGWGMQLCNKLEEWHADVTTPGWHFPDQFAGKRNSDPLLREARLLIYSIWLHSALVGEAPEWLDRACGVFARSGCGAIVRQLERLKADQVACDWGDHSADREPSRAMTIISLHRLLAHPVLTKPFHEMDEGEGVSDDRSLGSVCLFTSFIPDDCFIGLVRPWMRSIFAMIRNSEITLYSDKLVQTLSARERLRGAGFIVHEINALFKQFSDIRSQMEMSDSNSTANRCFVWDMVSSLVDLAWKASKMSVLATPEVRDKVAHDFLRPLQELASRGLLLRALESVASKVYHVSKPGPDSRHGASIPALRNRVDLDITYPQYARCYLLVAELVRNCCAHAEVNTIADWRVNYASGLLTISLRQVERHFKPTSPTLDTLKQLLEELGIGEVIADWEEPDQLFHWVLKLRVSTHAQG